VIMNFHLDFTSMASARVLAAFNRSPSSLWVPGGTSTSTLVAGGHPHLKRFFFYFITLLFCGLICFGAIIAPHPPAEPNRGA